MAKSGCTFEQTHKSLLPPELSEGLGEHSHRADEDAVRQAWMFRRMQSHVPA